MCIRDSRNVVQGRDGLRQDLGLAVSLDITQLVDFLAHNKAEGDPFSSRSTGTSDPVYIILIILGDVIVKHRLHVIHIDACLLYTSRCV